MLAWAQDQVAWVLADLSNEEVFMQRLMAGCLASFVFSAVLLVAGVEAPYGRSDDMMAPSHAHCRTRTIQHAVGPRAGRQPWTNDRRTEDMDGSGTRRTACATAVR